jgi:hypothetical protein
MSAGPRVLLLMLSERTSGRGNRYLSGWLGKASVVAFAGEPDKHGNPTWDLFVSESQPRDGQQQSKPEARRDTPDKPSARPVEPGSGWRGPSRYVRGDGARRAPAADHQPFYDDSLEDVGR